MTAQLTANSVSDDPRVRDALRKAMIARIATVSARGAPLIMPLYFVVLDGCMYMNTTATSPTVRDIAVNPDVLVLLEGRDGAIVRVRGTARYLRDASTVQRMKRAAIPKYVLRPRALWFWLRSLRRLPSRARYTRERTNTGTIEVAPTSWTVTDA